MQRWQGLSIGFVAAVTVVAVLVWLVVPWIVSTILVGATDLDQRLRERGRDLVRLCAEPPREATRAELCGCVASTQTPALDCIGPLGRWALPAQRQRCATPEVRRASPSFCACVDEADPMRGDIYARCESLDDALELPSSGDPEP